jgi:hypothetical protein
MELIKFYLIKKNALGLEDYGEFRLLRLPSAEKYPKFRTIFHGRITSPKSEGAGHVYVL